MALAYPVGFGQRFRFFSPPSVRHGREVRRVGQVAHRLALVGKPRGVALLQAGQGRQDEAAGDEAQGRGRVVLRMVDEAILRVRRTRMAGIRVPGPPRSPVGTCAWS